MTSLTAFLFAAFVLAITPGPGLAYVVSRTVAGGRAEGLASCMGTAVGGMLHVIAAALGLSLLVARSAIAFSAIKMIGAAYLVYLGVQALKRMDDAASVPTGIAQGRRRAFRDGVVVEALNVKTALFFVAFLPQFVSTALPLLAQLVVLGSICVAFNTVADVLAVLAAQKLLHSATGRAAHRRLLSGASGLTMIGLGVWLALTRRTA
jgi:threonine/homoserine/homoserine lactone efflux protein